MKKILEYIGIEKIGWLEFIMALYPILAGYGYGSFQLAFGVLFILDVLIVFKGKSKFLRCLPLGLFFSFVLLHDALLLPFLSTIPSYYINSFIANIIYAASVFIIAPQLDYQKFKSALFVVAIISMIGMVYHLSLLSLGKSVSPIKLPFLPEMRSTSRLYEIVERPTSFFWEPQSYASFMLIPLYISLLDRKYLLALLIAELMVASTSTTGLLLSILMFFLAITWNGGKWYVMLSGLIAASLLVYFLNTSIYATAGIEKFMNTEFEESNRIVNGYLIAKNMDTSELFFGIQYANEQDAYDAGHFGSDVIVLSDGVLFISAVWIALVRYGIIGLFLFLLPYFWIYAKNKQLFPLLLCIIIAHFSNSDFIGASYIFQLLFMLTFIRFHKQ